MPDNNEPKGLELDDNGEGTVENLHQLAQGLELTNEKVAELDEKVNKFRGRSDGTKVHWPWLKKETPPTQPASNP